MDIEINIKIFLLLFSATLSISTIIYFIVKGRKTPLLFSYISVMVLLAVWTLAQIYEMKSFDRQSMWTAVRIKYFASCFIGVSGLIFSLIYTKYVNITKRHILLLSLPSIAFYLALLTNDYHNLFFTEFDFNLTKYGPFFWIHTCFSYLYCIVESFLVLKYSFKKSGYFKRQAIIILIAITFPFLSNIVVIANLINPILDITPISFTFTYLLFALATFKYRFMDIIPQAYKKIMDNINESIIVIDSMNNIINYNKTFISDFSKYSTVKTDYNLSNWINELSNYIENNKENTKTLDLIKTSQIKQSNLELCLKLQEKKFYSVSIQPVSRNDLEIIGKIIIFNDITEYKKLFIELDRKNVELYEANQELLSMNEELKNYALTVEEVASLRERNRMARDIHDTLGNTLTLIVKLAEVSKLKSTTDENLEKIIEISLRGIKEIRRSVSPLTPQNYAKNDFIDSLNKLVSNFTSSTGVNIKISTNFEADICNTTYTKCIYRICQESITNSIRHGGAKNISILIKVINNTVKLYISDDGKGCKTIKEGFGLRGINQRAKDLNGHVNFYTEQSKGFSSYIEIPMKASNNTYCEGINIDKNYDCR